MPVLWTCWGRGWTRGATPASVASTVLRGLSGGGTILLPDSDIAATPGSWRATLGALPQVLDPRRAPGPAVPTAAGLAAARAAPWPIPGVGQPPGPPRSTMACGPADAL